MIRFILAFFLAIFTLNASQYSIVYIHIGKEIPDYCYVAAKQARLFNPDCPIVIIANKAALKHANRDPAIGITYVPCESLKKTRQHNQFSSASKLDNKWREGFWRYTSERFLYLQDYLVSTKQRNIFHMEYDNMLYADLSKLLPIFEENYPGIAGTFDNDVRCIPGFIYIKNEEVMTTLAQFFANVAPHGYNDMEVIAKFKNSANRKWIDHLPIITPEYVEKVELKSDYNHTTQVAKNYCKHFELFQSVFDAAALGQFLGGTDPRNGPSKPGFINESCLFNASRLQYMWEVDSQGRRIPYLMFDGKRARINNLHIHSKELEKFASWKVLP